MRERQIEKTLCQMSRDKGGLAVKMTGDAGIPDRLVLLPGGFAAFVETKTEVGRLSPRQHFYRQRLESLGFQVWVIRSQQDTIRFFEAVDSRAGGKAKRPQGADLERLSPQQRMAAKAASAANREEERA